MTNASRPARPTDAGEGALLWPVEGLRGIAAFTVLWVHYRGLVTSGRDLGGFGFTGVDLFFVLSGFVFAPYVFGRPLMPGPYAVRRVLRIYPLYLASLAVYVLLRLWQGGEPLRYVWQHVFMLHTTVSPEIAQYYNVAFWSLPPELEFYVLVPLLAWLAQRGRWWFPALLVAALLAHLALARWGVPGQAPHWAVVANVHWPALWIEFLLGCLAWRGGQVLAGRLPPRHWLLPAMLAAALLLWLAAAMLWVAWGDAGVDARRWLRGNLGLWSACAYALGLAALMAWLRRAQDARGPAAVHGTVPGATGAGASPWWVRLSLLGGQLSYGVYLLHNAALTAAGLLWPQTAGWTRLGLAVLLTLAATWALHHAVEAPARDWGRRLSARLVARQRSRARIEA